MKGCSALRFCSARVYVTAMRALSQGSSPYVSCARPQRGSCTRFESGPPSACSAWKVEPPVTRKLI